MVSCAANLWKSIGRDRLLCQVVSVLSSALSKGLMLDGWSWKACLFLVESALPSESRNDVVEGGLG